MELDLPLTMQETCVLCNKKQETNDIFHRYEYLGFSLCDNCDSLGTREINKRWKEKQCIVHEMTEEEINTAADEESIKYRAGFGMIA